MQTKYIKPSERANDLERKIIRHTLKIGRREKGSKVKAICIYTMLEIRVSYVQMIDMFI